MRATSWDINEKPKSERYFILAQSYIECSISIFESILQKSLEATYSNGHSGAFLFGHSLELFLKGAIIYAKGKVDNIHNLENLYNEFKKSYPGKNFEFNGEIDDFIKQDKLMPYNKFFRYPIDNEGNVWFGNYFYNFEIWNDQLRKFKNDYKRLLTLIKNRYKK